MARQREGIELFGEAGVAASVLVGDPPRPSQRTGFGPASRYNGLEKAQLISTIINALTENTEAVLPWIAAGSDVGTAAGVVVANLNQALDENESLAGRLPPAIVTAVRDVAGAQSLKLQFKDLYGSPYDCVHEAELAAQHLWHGEPNLYKGEHPETGEALTDPREAIVAWLAQGGPGAVDAINALFRGPDDVASRTARLADCVDEDSDLATRIAAIPGYGSRLLTALESRGAEQAAAFAPPELIKAPPMSWSGF